MDNQNQNAYGPLESVNISQNGNEGNKKHGYRMLLITVIVLLVAVGGIIVSKNEHLQQIIKGNKVSTQTVQTSSGTGEPIEIPSSTVQDRAVPWLEVVSDQGTQGTVGQPMTLYVRGLSAEKSIIGYDMAVAVDRSILKIESISSELPDYQLKQFDNTSYVSLTGFRDLQKQSVVFDNTNIVKIVVTPIKAGTAIVSLLPQQGKDKTQMVVDTDVTVIQPQIGSIQLEIR